MRREDFTAQDYENLVNFMEAFVPGLKVLKKEDAIEHQLIAKALEQVGPLAGELWVSSADWMSRYATTIGTRVSIPDEWAPAVKACALVHEVMHVLQYQKTQPQSDLPQGLEWGWLYLTWGQARVRSEVEAYRAGQLEFCYALFRELPSLDSVVAPLEGTAYLLSESDRELARDLLASAGTTVESGVSASTEAGRLGIQWAESRGLL